MKNALKTPKSVKAFALVVASLLIALDTNANPAKFPRLHLSVSTSLYYTSNGGTTLTDELVSWGFNDRERTWILGWDSMTPGTPIQYPYAANQGGFLRMINLSITYSISPSFALGFATSPLATFSACGFDGYGAPVTLNGDEYDWGTILNSDVRGRTYYLTASYMPVALGRRGRLAPEIGLGLGMSAVDLIFEASGNSYYSASDRKAFSRTSFSGLVFAGLNYWFSRHLSLGVCANYRYVRFEHEAFQLSYGPAGSLITYGLPGQTLTLGELSLNLRFSLHV